MSEETNFSRRRVPASVGVAISGVLSTLPGNGMYPGDKIFVAGHFILQAGEIMSAVAGRDETIAALNRLISTIQARGNA